MNEAAAVIPGTARKGALAFVFVALLVDSVGFGIVLPVFPQLIMSLAHVDIADAARYGGWLAFAYSLTQFFCAPVLGNLSDRFGRRPVLLFALLALGIDYLVMGFAPVLSWLFVGRTIAGIAGASFTPAYAYVADITPPERRARNFGLMGAAFGIGFIVGPAIGGLLGSFGPRAPFIAAGVIALANTSFGFFALPESLPGHLRRPFDWSRANPLGTLKQMRRYPMVAWMIGALFLWQLGHQVLPATWAFYTIAKFHWTSKGVGYSLAFVGVLMAVAQGALTPWLIPKLGGEKRAAAVGMAAAIVAYLGYGLVPEGWMMYVVSLTTMVFAMAYPAMNALMSHQIPPNAQGELQGAVASVYSLSAIIGPPLLTQIFGYFSSPAAPVYFPGAAFVTAALLTSVCVVLYARALRAAVVVLAVLACIRVGDTRAAQLTAVKPTGECGSLVHADMAAAVGAPVHLESAQAIHSGPGGGYCQVSGTVAPAVRFEVRLPLSGWTQRFVQTGCGGLCGQLDIHLDKAQTCTPATHGELVLASTDMGHQGGMDGSWGRDNAQARVDFAYRGVHVTTLAAKALIQAYYGQPARYSYFFGCSDGGREALMEAQRFPQDFNGIMAGAPAMNFTTQNSFYHGWNATQNRGADGQPILTADKLPILHRAVLEQCDAADGLRDGLISDPVHCRPDLSKVTCTTGADTSQCLTAAQARVATEIYGGAHDAAGRGLVIGGPLPGSELGWLGVFVPPQGQANTMSGMIAEGTIRNLLYQPNPPANMSLRDFKFDAANFAAATRYHSLYDSTDTDLTRFAKSGGHLILWHGLADPHISPMNTVAYYEGMQRAMGAAAVDGFARLYLFPGGGHCGGGEGPFDFDLVTAMMGWVEEGKVPGALIAQHSAGSAGVVDRTRPVYPYPQVAVYGGKGSIDEAASFKAGEGKPWEINKSWYGGSFFDTHGHSDTL